MFRKVLAIIVGLITIFVFDVIYNNKVLAGGLQSFNVAETPTEVGVFLMSDDNPYVYSIAKALEENFISHLTVK